MIVSRDINSTKEPETRVFTIDIIPTFRRYYNSIVVLNPDYNENWDPYAEEEEEEEGGEGEGEGEGEDGEEEEEEQEEEVIGCHYYLPDLTSDDRLFFLEIPYPEEFIRSPLQKFVRVLGCSYIVKTYSDLSYQKEKLKEIFDWKEGTFKLAGMDISKDTNLENDTDRRYTLMQTPHVSLHSSIAQDSTLVNDSFVCKVNNVNPFTSASTFEVHTTHRSFKIWFVDETELKILSLFTISRQLSSIRLKLELQY